jgi:hypothetical protein
LFLGNINTGTWHSTLGESQELGAAHRGHGRDPFQTNSINMERRFFLSRSWVPLLLYVKEDLGSKYKRVISF